MPLFADSHLWHGQHLTANILYSHAGVATHTIVSAGTHSVLIDTGDGCLRDLLDSDLPLETIKGIIYTHGHFDHVGGLHSVLGFMRMIGRKDPLPIFAPEGCTEVFATALNFRRCYPDSVPFEMPLKELHPHQVLEFGCMRIEGFPVVHAGSVADGGILDPIPAFGYRLSCHGETVAITGDTGLCEELKTLVKNADFAILEATFDDTTNIDPEMFTRVHLSENIARELGSTAKDFVLIHRARTSHDQSTL